MSKYTLELRRIQQSHKIFDFDYDFYTNDETIKYNFEDKFINEYYFNEIGFETIHRFKQRLRTKLNKIMPYYTQLYQTELRSKDIDFMLNKDLTETFIKEFEGTTSNELDNTNSSNTSNTLSETENNINDINESVVNTNVSDFKESNIEMGNASIELQQGSITNVNNTISENNNITSSKLTNNKNVKSDLDNTFNSSLKSNSNEVRKETETNTLTSKGNIGVTSSAELLEKWRKVIINIDDLIINECSDLFIQVY